MNWVMILLAVAGVAILVRIYMNVRKARSQRPDDWDSQLIAQLRQRGQDPFALHDVDFFFALPDEQATAAVNQQLEGEGFRVDVKAVPQSAEFPFSLHATKAMRLNVHDMREIGRRFGELASANRGRYDGWGSS